MDIDRNGPLARNNRPVNKPDGRSPISNGHQLCRLMSMGCTTAGAIWLEDRQGNQVPDAVHP